MSPGLFPHGGVALRHVRLHGGGDALHARQRLERLLGEVDWSPLGLGPRALLLVRRLAVDARRGFAPRVEGGAFARQVSGALRERAADARRPWLQHDASTADAVCFADEAELFACLWRDWASGAGSTPWWWAAVLRHQAAAPWLREQLFARGDRLVPALALLVGQGAWRACIQKMDEGDAARALGAVQASHGLVARVLADATQARSSSQAPGAAAAAPGLPQAPAASRSRPPLALGRLLATVPELRQLPAGPMARRLLAVALALQRAPRWARSPALPQALAEMQAAPLAAAADALAAEESRAGAAGPPPSAPPHAAARLPRATARPPGRRGAPTPTAVPASLPPGPDPALSTPGRAARPSRAEQDSHLPGGATTAEVRWPEPAAPHPTPVGVTAPAALREAARAPAARPAARPAAGSALLHTRYGGLFYLLNIALAWRLYGDFTMPRHRGISLPPWDLLAWSGRAWFGPDFEADPLWPALAQLAGRERPANPGDDFDDAPDWAPQAAAEVACPEAAAEAHRGHRWLRHWRAAVETRLRSALACHDGIDLLCCHGAGVAVSEAAVDVTLSLADLPLPVRIAGLDRDPGWIPAAGRSVFFHFD